MIGKHNSTDAALLRIVQDETLEIVKSMTWSTWHVAEFIRSMDRNSLAGTTDEAKFQQYQAYWDQDRPFGSCVDVSQALVRRLRDRLCRESCCYLREYSNSVHLMAAYREESNGLVPYHCAVLIPAQEPIVVDLCFHLAPIVLPLDSDFYTMPLTLLDGREHIGRYSLTVRDERYVFSFAFAVLGNDFRDVNECRIISYKDAVKQINFPLGREHDEERRNGHIVQAKRNLVISTALDKQPKSLHYLRVKNHYLAHTCRISIDFARGTILLQIPRRDFISSRSRETECLKLALEGHSMVYLLANTTKVLNVILHFDRDMSVLPDRIEIMADVAERLGMPRKELYRIVQSVFFEFVPRGDFSYESIRAFLESKI